MTDLRIDVLLLIPARLSALSGGLMHMSRVLDARPHLGSLDARAVEHVIGQLDEERKILVSTISCAERARERAAELIHTALSGVAVGEAVVDEDEDEDEDEILKPLRELAELLGVEVKAAES